MKRKPWRSWCCARRASRLKDFDARTLFPRSWGWRAYSLVPLAALWLAMLYLSRRGFRSGRRAGPASCAARRSCASSRAELQEKAQSEGLPQTLEAGRELEKIAQRGIDAKTADEQFKSELAGFAEKMAAERNSLPGRRRSAWLKAAGSSRISGPSWKRRASCSTRQTAKGKPGRTVSPA